MQTPPKSFGTIVGIDPALRVPVKRTEIVMPASLAADVLGRAPDVALSGIVSWGHLTLDAIRELITLDREPSEADESLDEIHSLFDGRGSAELHWCLSYRETDHGE